MSLAAAQGLPQFPQDEVLVIVWRDAGRCSVLERKTTCTRVAGLMTDIKAAGFRNVRPAGTHR